MCSCASVLKDGFVGRLFLPHSSLIVPLIFSLSLSASLAQSHTQDGQTALICAAREGHMNCARLLLDAGADKEAKNNVRASWFAASAAVHVFRTLSMFLNYSCDFVCFVLYIVQYDVGVVGVCVSLALTDARACPNACV